MLNLIRPSSTLILGNSLALSALADLSALYQPECLCLLPSPSAGLCGCPAYALNKQQLLPKLQCWQLCNRNFCLRASWWLCLHVQFDEDPEKITMVSPARLRPQMPDDSRSKSIDERHSGDCSHRCLASRTSTKRLQPSCLHSLCGV